MLRYILVIPFLLFSSIVLAHGGECKKWQYASLSLTTLTIIKNQELQDVHTTVLWEAPNEYGIWQNNKLMSGTIKATLTTHFGIKSVHAPSILNKIGENGWEAYDFHRNSTSENEQSRLWQLKKCTG